MNRVDIEKLYWDTNATDKDVDVKYISDISANDCLKDLTGLGEKVLEIGCGVGRLLKPGYYGIDISTNMLEIANQRKPKCVYKHTDGRSIPFQDDSFDSVYCYLVFQHLPDDAMSSYIEEAHRVLKDGGLFIFQWIEGTEQEPFSFHRSTSTVDEMAKRFWRIQHQSSEAYDGWTITRCIK